MMLLSLALASSLCLHRPSPVRLASRSRPALCLTTDPPATEAAVVNLALRSKVQPQIVKLVGAAESCQLMDQQQIDTLVGKIVDWCVDNCCDSLSKVWCEHLQHDLVNVASKGAQQSLRAALDSYRPEVLPPKVTHVPPSRLPPSPLPTLQRRGLTVTPCMRSPARRASPSSRPTGRANSIAARTFS